MRAQHTPGPWVVTDGGGLIAPGGSMVAVTCSANGRHADAGVWAQSGCEGAEADANARLIAAAPELLAAAEAFQNWAGGIRRWPLSMGCSPNDASKRYSEIRELEVKFRTAIRRARGEE